MERGTRPTAATGGAADWPMVGRDDELGWARLRLDEPGQSVVLAGVAGVGKSRLAEAVALELEAQSITVRRIIASAATSTIPFGAFGPLLWSADHAHLGQSGAIDAALAVRRALEASTPANQLALSIDDAHLLDASSAALVRHLAADGQTRLVLTIRTGEVVPDDITAVWKDHGANRFDLQALSEQETAELLRTTLGGPVQPHTAAQLFECSGGNPLYLREVVLHSLACGLLLEHRGAWRLAGSLDTGPRLHELVQQRLDGLSHPTLDLVRVASFGEPLPVALVEALGAFDALVDAEDRSLVTTSSGPEPDVRMAHPVYREVIRTSTGAAARRQVHARLHAVADDTIDPIRRVLWWQESARRDRIPIDLALRASALARRESAPELALRLLEGLEVSAAVALERGHALFVSGREGDAIEQFEIAAALAEDDQQRAEACAAHINALVYGFDDLPGAQRLLDEAEQTISDEAALDFVRSLHVSFVTLAGGEADVDLVARFLTHEDPLVRLRAFPAGSQMLLRQGRVDDAVALAAAHVPAAMEATDELPDALTWVLTALTTNRLMACDLDEVELLLALARGMGTEPGPQNVALIDLVEGRLRIFQGRIRTASEYLRRSLAVMEDALPNSSYTTWALSLQAECAALLGDAEAANEARLQAEGRDTFDVAMIALDAQRARAWVPAAALDRVGASRELVLLAEQCRAAQQPLVEIHVLFDAFRLGAPVVVQQRLLEVARTVQGQWPPLFRDHVEAHRARDVVALEDVARRYEARGLDLYAVDAWMHAATASRTEGRTTDAARSCGHATRIAQRCEGVRPLSIHDVGPASADELTFREREIAQLAARGLTSREIAEHLIVSRRTVDNQLGRIYLKLGITGRHELAEVLDEHHPDI